MEITTHLSNPSRGFYSRLAKVTNYNRSHISKVLRGKAGYSKSMLESLAHALNVDVGWLADYIAGLSCTNEPNTS